MTFSIKTKSQMKGLQLLKHKPQLTELFKTSYVNIIPWNPVLMSLFQDTSSLYFINKDTSFKLTFITVNCQNALHTQNGLNYIFYAINNNKTLNIKYTYNWMSHCIIKRKETIMLPDAKNTKKITNGNCSSIDDDKSVTVCHLPYWAMEHLKAKDDSMSSSATHSVNLYRHPMCTRISFISPDTTLK